jgi:selenide, water dikinase
MPLRALAPLVQGLPRFSDPDLLIGAEHFSDAGVYRIAERLAIVQSLDFFGPLVDDAFMYGQIAAANAISDIYATGGTPKTALNIVAFPDDKLDMKVLQEILRGGADRVMAAGAVVVGGHSVRDAEIVYGLCVTGVVDPQRMISNAYAKPGDVLVLTKAIGTGFITTAHRAGRCPADTLAAACAGMVQLNKEAAEAATALGVRAATDVTGFGLAGHASEMAQASGVTIHLEAGRVPLLPGVAALATAANRSRANVTNREFVAQSMRIEPGVSPVAEELLFDPQTSGGLLLAAPTPSADELIDRCRQAGLEHTARVGRVEPKGDCCLVISP